jgi:hypothetical protein
MTDLPMTLVTLAATVAAVAIVGTTMGPKPAPRFVWNVSESVPNSASDARRFHASRAIRFIAPSRSIVARGTGLTPRSRMRSGHPLQRVTRRISTCPRTPISISPTLGPQFLHRHSTRRLRRRSHRMIGSAAGRAHCFRRSRNSWTGRPAMLLRAIHMRRTCSRLMREAHIRQSQHCKPIVCSCPGRPSGGRNDGIERFSHSVESFRTFGSQAWGRRACDQRTAREKRRLRPGACGWSD